MSSATVIRESSPAQPAPQVNLTMPSDRRADIDAKHAAVVALLETVKCEGLLVLAPDNFSWLTAGAVARGILDDTQFPALYFSPDGRWLLSSNVDTQRLFDEEIDGLGFQLKEWPWHWGRAQLVADLCQGRSVAVDRPINGCQQVGDRLRQLRRKLTAYEQACYRALGQILSHALEACCRTLQPGETEREVAGQISHRLLHRGAAPLCIQAAADERGEQYRQSGFTSATVQSYCTLRVVARKYGLCAAASRTVCFGQPEAALRRDHDTVCKVTATYVASSWPDAVPKQILATGRRIYQLSGAEHEWLLAPQGHVTGRAPVELALLPQTEELLQSGWAVTWQGSCGSALSCDTFLVSEDGPRAVTAPENWPLKRIRVQGAEFVRPDLLVR
ncbi:MAG: M24 family metallopeptidase [Gemmataceae bacterium]|nr:M24 family metallopeptidase [Gemmataceae bacterium]